MSDDKTQEDLARLKREREQQARERLKQAIRRIHDKEKEKRDSEAGQST